MPREWEILQDWLMTTGLRPSDVMEAVKEFQERLAAIAEADMRRARENESQMELPINATPPPRPLHL